MGVNATLDNALACLQSTGPDGTPSLEAARLWLNRVEALLAWVSVHPRMVEIRDEAARLLLQYRGSATATAPPDPAATRPA